jgi:hypothetical protein
LEGLRAAERDSTDEAVRKKHEEIQKLEAEHATLTKGRL